MKQIANLRLGNIFLTCLFLIVAASWHYTLAQSTKNKLVTGIVTDASNNPLPGVNITIKGTNTGTVTDLEGRFSIELPDGSETLVFSMMGMLTEEYAVVNQKDLTVVLVEDLKSLDEVVVIGYGTTTKKEVTGSIATIKSDEFNRGAYNNPMGLLQGKVAGLTIVQPDGADPMADYNIILRGTNTLTSGQAPLIIIDGVLGADLKSISPEEVESVDVLKDGAAAAIYGTRGSNGVIIITTKRAKAGESHLEYTGQLSVQVAPRRVENLSADEFRESINTYAPDKAASIYGGNTDWFDEITLPTPFSQKHNIAISGGNETFSHRSIIYVDNSNGLLKDNLSNKYLIKTNITQKLLDDMLLLDYNVSYSNRKYKPANYDLFYQAFIRNPTSPVYDPNNEYSGGYTVLEGIEYYNPVAMLNERTRDGKTTNANGNLRATLKLTQSLKWINFISIDQSDWEEMSYKTQFYPTILGTGGEAEISNGKSNNLIFESTLNLIKSIGNHNFQSMAGYSYEENETNDSYMINSGFDTDYYGPHNIGDGSALGVGLAEMGSHKESNKLISFFGRVMYNFNERYLAALTLRHEGSSRFGANNKWSWFPSVSLGWRINKEPFMEDVDWVNDLKLRVGYGVTGNQEFENYKSLVLLGSKVQKFYYRGQWINTYGTISNPNPELRWEKKQELNMGIDYSLFKNRISGALEYYYRTSTDLLYTYIVPSNTPPYLYTEIFANIGTISNQGIELTLSAVALKKATFNWNTTFTFSKNINKLIKFSNEEFTNEYVPTGWLGSAFPLYSERIEEGKPLGVFYGPVWLGLDENGKDKFKNANPIGKVDVEDWEPIGNAYPFCSLGWSNMFTYKDWDLNFSFRSNIGGDVLNMSRLYYENWQSLGRNIVHTQLENPEFTGIGQYSSKYVENATFLKLDNISVGYNLPYHSKIISKVRFNLTAQNVFTITGYKGLDPEVDLSGLEPGIEHLSYYPRTTSITFGVNVTF
ncbi:MAG TPA: TonB-dependent receptor [Marinilabiliales bacterium]|nr:TonB-dependent receptor [Marinilabiliales bacterium]